jgi:hypothetical protein
VGHVRPGPNEVSGETGLMYQVVGRHFVPHKAGPPEKPVLEVVMGYDRTSLSTADQLRARAAVKYNGRGADVPGDRGPGVQFVCANPATRDTPTIVLSRKGGPAVKAKAFALGPTPAPSSCPARSSWRPASATTPGPTSSGRSATGRSAGSPRAGGGRPRRSPGRPASSSRSCRSG